MGAGSVCGSGWVVLRGGGGGGGGWGGGMVWCGGQLYTLHKCETCAMFILHLCIFLSLVLADIPLTNIATPPGPIFPAAIWIEFYCHVDLQPEPVTIDRSWRIVCIDDPDNYAGSDFEGILYPSSLTICLVTVQCAVHEAGGMWGISDFIEIANTTGKCCFVCNESILVDL